LKCFIYGVAIVTARGHHLSYFSGKRSSPSGNFSGGTQANGCVLNFSQQGMLELEKQTRRPNESLPLLTKEQIDIANKSPPLDL
jgi:hypothetical protein